MILKRIEIDVNQVELLAFGLSIHLCIVNTFIDF